MPQKYPNRVYGDFPMVYLLDTTQRYPIGQLLELPNGALYRYARSGNDNVVAAKLAQAELGAENWDTVAVQATVSVGDTTIPFTNPTTNIAENEFAEGTVLVESAAALGHAYPIKSNDAETSTPGTCTLTLTDGVTVQAALTTSHKVTVVKNPWDKIIIQPAVQTAMVVGVPQIDLPATELGWVQTSGVCNILCDSGDTHALIIGQGVRPSENDTGAMAFHDFSEAADADQGFIGWAMLAGVDAQFAAIILRID